MNELNNFDLEFKELAAELMNKANTPDPIGPITPEMCLKAAQIVADCPPEKKYAVVFLLECGGFDVHGTMVREKASRKMGGLENVGRMIEDARTKYGVGIRELARKSGLSATLFYAYMNGENNPRKETARKIVKSIKQLAPNMDTDAYIKL